MGEAEIFFRPFHHPLLVVEFDSPYAYIGNSNVVDFGSHSVSVPRLRQFRLAGTVVGPRKLTCSPLNEICRYANCTCSNIGSPFDESAHTLSNVVRKSEHIKRCPHKKSTPLSSSKRCEELSDIVSTFSNG